ncbi:MAG: hypothetical protein AB9891_03525 [Anaerolineaceae bacterium]
MDFVEADRKYREWKRLFDLGQMEGAEFEKRVNELRLTGPDGSLWQMGVKSGLWYHFNGQAWVEDNPFPPELGTVVQASDLEPPPPPREPPGNIRIPPGRPAPQKKKLSSLVLVLIGLAGLACVSLVVGGIVIMGNLPGPVPTPLAETAITVKNSPEPPASSPYTAAPPSETTPELTTEQANPGQGGYGIPFQDRFDDPASGWDDIRVGENFNTLYFEDAYLIVVTTNHYSAWANPGLDLATNIQVEVDARKTSGSTYDEYGLLCRYQENSDDTINAYYFAISNDGLGLIYKIDHDEKTLLLSDPPEKRSDVILPGDQINRIRADCLDGTLALYVNDQKLVSVQDSSFLSGDVGLRADSEEGETEIRFDNFIVYEP